MSTTAAPPRLIGDYVLERELGRGAFGVVAYRLLTGRLPFPGPTIQELTSQILYGAVKPPSAACPGPVDPELDRAGAAGNGKVSITL